MTTKNKTIVAFHVGPGGRFQNSGFKSFFGQYNIYQVISRVGDSKWLFEGYENESVLRRKIKGYSNLTEKLDWCRDNQDFTFFEKRLNYNMGDFGLLDSNGNFMISQKNIDTGVGVLDFDGNYDKYYTCYIDDCEEEELLCIAKSNEWNKLDILEEAGFKNVNIFDGFDMLSEMVQSGDSFEENFKEITEKQYENDDDAKKIGNKYYTTI